MNQVISQEALDCVVASFHLNKSSVAIKGVEGGYSRNRRSIVGDGDRWVFVKEVDLQLLPDNGETELQWLSKDFSCIKLLRDKNIDIAPENPRLLNDGKILCIKAYCKEEGWLWGAPQDTGLLDTYVQVVLDNIMLLEKLEISDRKRRELKLSPFLRDKLGNDSGIDLLRSNHTHKKTILDKYNQLIDNERNKFMASAYCDMLKLLRHDRSIQSITDSAEALLSQPNSSFGHGDVRSDNITFNLVSGKIKFVDWNWSSYVPKGFGATEFLVDLSRRGLDVTPWLSYLNKELLAAMVCFYAKRCLLEDLAPGNSLRIMQAQSAAVAARMYSLV
ncbi:MAG: hypothetical protein Q4B06_01085 [Candidatus Saccharibacteria bacterium]|nr:hypothetical protein [Candidatus Saccharibacteria bacterium]